MKRLMLLLIPTLLAFSAASAAVQVQWSNPRQFRDAADGYPPTERDRKSVLSELERYISRLGDRYVPEGYILEMDFTNVDLEGEFEPFNGAGFNDVRIIKDIYPARLQFSYTVKNKDGAVVAQGQESLSHNMIMPPPIPSRNEQFPYTYELLSEWFRDNLPGLKSKDS